MSISGNVKSTKWKSPVDDNPLYAEISPNALQTLFEEISILYYELKHEIEELFWRIIYNGGGSNMKQCFVGEPPLVMLTDTYDGEIFGNNTAAVRGRVLKRFCLETPWPLKLTMGEKLTPDSF